MPVFGFIGRLEEQKGVDILLEALPEIAKTGGVQVRLMFSGVSPRILAGVKESGVHHVGFGLITLAQEACLTCQNIAKA